MNSLNSISAYGNYTVYSICCFESDFTLNFGLKYLPFPASQTRSSMVEIHKTLFEKNKYTALVSAVSIDYYKTCKLGTLPKPYCTIDTRISVVWASKTILRMHRNGIV